MADDSTLDAGRKAAVAERDAEVTAAIASRNVIAAVRAALTNPPLGTKDDSIKVSSLSTLCRSADAASVRRERGRLLPPTPGEPASQGHECVITAG